MHRVAVLMQDDFGILGIVDAALAKAQLILFVGGEGVVLTPLIDANGLSVLIDGPAGCSEAKALDIFLCLSHPIIGHHLLKAIVVPAIAEIRISRIGWIAGFADDVGPIAAKIPATVKVGQRYDAIGRLQGGIVGVLL